MSEEEAVIGGVSDYTALPGLRELEARFSERDLHAGEIVRATVTAIEDQRLLVEIQGDKAGALARAELPEAKVGDDLEVYLEDVDAEPIGVSHAKAEDLILWNRIAHAHVEREIVSGTIVACVRGGLSVDIGMRAFLPGGQLKPSPALIGREFDFRVRRFDERKAEVVLGLASPALTETGEKFDLSALEEGALIDAVVRRMTNFGAFVDIGGFDALLHINDMSWRRLEHPREALHIGQEIKVKILKVDKQATRVGVGLKQVGGEDPWADYEVAVGDVVEGPVVGMSKFGAFVAVKDGVEGMVHVSEMSWERLDKPQDKVKQGEVIKAEVIEFDKAEKRLKLSMRRVEKSPWTGLDERYKPGTRLRGPIERVTDFGIFVTIEEGVAGLVHKSDMSWSGGATDPRETYTVVDEVEVMLLDIDMGRQRVSLGVKQLGETDALKGLEVGQIIEGPVTGLARFGAFVEVGEGVQGLIHVTELAEERPKAPGDLVQEGQVVKAKIIALDRLLGKVKLSIKQLDAEPAAE